MNGKRYTETVIEAAWRYLLINMCEGKDVTSAAIVARCPGVPPERVRVGFKRRLASWICDVRRLAFQRARKTLQFQGGWSPSLGGRTGRGAWTGLPPVSLLTTPLQKSI